MAGSTTGLGLDVMRWTNCWPRMLPPAGHSESRRRPGRRLVATSFAAPPSPRSSGGLLSTWIGISAGSATSPSSPPGRPPTSVTARPPEGALDDTSLSWLSDKGAITVWPTPTRSNVPLSQQLALALRAPPSPRRTGDSRPAARPSVQAATSDPSCSTIRCACAGDPGRARDDLARAAGARPAARWADGPRGRRRDGVAAAGCGCRVAPPARGSVLAGHAVRRVRFEDQPHHRRTARSHPRRRGSLGTTSLRSASTVTSPPSDRCWSSRALRPDRLERDLLFATAGRHHRGPPEWTPLVRPGELGKGTIFQLGAARRLQQDSTDDL